MMHPAAFAEPMPSWSQEARVPIPPDRVLAWLTDFTADDHTSDAFVRGSGLPKGYGGASTRRVVRREGNVWIVHDDWGRRSIDSRVEVDPVARTVTYTQPQNPAYRNVWRVLPDGDGSRVVTDVRMEARGIWHVIGPFFEGKMRKLSDADFRGHIEDLKESFARASAP